MCHMNTSPYRRFNAVQFGRGFYSNGLNRTTDASNGEIRMNIVVANLYKRFQAGSLPNSIRNTFSLIGHFDYLQFVTVPFKSLFDQYGDRDKQREIHPAWSGFNSQSLYLLSFPEEGGAGTESPIYGEDDARPFCVVATIEDSEQFHVTAPFKSDAVLTKLRKYKKNYVDAFSEYMRKRSDGAGLSVRMEVFFTLSCIDTVLIFRTNNISLVHDFIFQLYMNSRRLMSYTIYGISTNYHLKSHRDEIEAEDNLRLSMRISFNPNINFKRMREIDNSIQLLTDNQSVTSVPAGRHHRLYYINRGVYNVLDACLNIDGQLSLSSSKNIFCKFINGYRFTLSFNDEARYPDYPDDDVEDTPVNGICETTRSVYNMFKALNRHWEAQIECTPDAGNVFFADLKAYAITVENTIREYMYFFACMDSHTRHMINYELSVSIIDPLRKLEQLILDFKEYVISLLEEDTLNAAIMYETFLDQIQFVISRFGNQVRDLIHMQQNRLEDKGVYRNDVAAAAKLCLGYYSYAHMLSNALFSTDKDSVTHGANNPFAFYINLEAMSDRVNATEHFSIVLNYQHQRSLPTRGALVGIDVSRQYVSDIFYVKAAITHEIAHFVGWRNRALRTECIVKSVCNILSLFMIPDLHCKDTEDSIAKEFFDENKKEIEHAAETIRISFVDQISELILKVFGLCFENELDWAFQKNCEDILILILQCWLDNPNASVKFDKIIADHYVDIPSIVVNLNAELNSKWAEIAFRWVKEKGIMPNTIIPYMFDFLASPVYSLNDAMNATKNRIEALINGDVFLPSSFYKVQFDEMTECLTQRTCIDSGDAVEMRPSTERKSLYDFVHAICNTYSETYCDLVMVKLLHMSAKQYIDYLYREDQLEKDACWRIWSVLTAAYDLSSVGDTLGRKIEKIRRSAGSYLHNEDVMRDYLNSIMNHSDMQALFNYDPGYFIPSDGKNTEDGNILHLYACYLQLHG